MVAAVLVLIFPETSRTVQEDEMRRNSGRNSESPLKVSGGPVELTFRGKASVMGL